MDTTFDFNNIYVFDLANNHQGLIEHGLRIIRECGSVARENRIRAALKFQFRKMDTLIHPRHLEGSSNRHIPRFLSTRLDFKDYAELAQEVKKSGMITMSTPFDEDSVDDLVNLDIEVIKIASCSATDWPLLDKIATCNKPVVVSTAGLSWEQIDNLISFFDHRRVHFALMHCVAIYPTPDEKLQLNQIYLLRQRYPSKTIGFSTHERPDDFAPVMVAVAKGARILERHVGIATDEIKLNAYSSTPEQLDRWIKAASKAQILCGADERLPSDANEISSLQSLQRGVYARLPIKKDALIERGNIYFAMPVEENHLVSGDWKEGIVAQTAIDRDQPLLLSDIAIPDDPERAVLFRAIHTAKAMLNEARIALPTEFETEFSHHYGIANLLKVGIIMITCVNRSYCKKIIVQLPGQRHPMHYHKQKEETFQVLHGILEMQIEDRRRTLYAGDIQLVQQGVWHEFWTEKGVIFEEVSSTHFSNDSFYEDKRINQQGVARKTIVNQWGRYQL